MSTDSAPSTGQPSAHPAWARAVAGPIDAGAAAALAEQVCCAPPERDWMLLEASGHPGALDEVLAPAVGALFAAWIDSVHPYEALTQGPAAGARRVSFAALCVCAAYLAWSQQASHRAHIYAFRSLDANPDAPSAPLARAILEAACAGRPWSAPSDAERADLAAAVSEHRATPAA